MSQKTKWIIGAIVIVLVVVGVVSATGSNNTPAGEEPVKIGISLPLTGPVSTLGKRSQQGMQLAASRINKDGGINGHPVELVFRDDKCNASQGVETVNNLLNAENANAMIVYCGAVTGAVADIIDGQALTLSVSVRTNPLKGKYPFLFNLSPNPAKEVEALMGYTQRNNIDKVAIIRQSDFFGETYASRFKEKFADQGNVAFDSSYENLNKPDYRTDLTKAKQQGVDAIFTSLNPPQLIVLLQQMDELGLNDVQLMATWNAQSQSLLDSVGELAEGMVYTYTFKKQGDSQYQEFVEDYSDRFGEPPEANAAVGYDGIQLIASAYESCGVNASVDCLVSEMDSVENFNGMSGDYSIKEKVADKEVYLKTVQDGEFVPLKNDTQN